MNEQRAFLMIYNERRARYARDITILEHLNFKVSVSGWSINIGV